MDTNHIDLKVHFDAVVVDTHNDTMMKIVDNETWLPKINIGDETTNHVDILKLTRGGLNVPFFAAFTEGYYDNIGKSLSRTLALVNGLYWTESNNKDTFKIAKNLKDIFVILKANKIAAVPTIEGGYCFDENNAIELLKQFDDLGIKAIGFNWNYSNLLGEGASRTYNDENKTPSSEGLTKLGEALALEMNKLGMVIDVSHMSENTFWDIINISKAPILASHSGVHTLRQHRRNLTDEQLKALAGNGGVISIVLCQEFLTSEPIANIKDFVDHIDYAVNLIGVDHVGIGSDFDGTTIPKDIQDSSELYKITEELIRRNYKKEDIEKILGKNILRLLKEVEDYGKSKSINYIEDSHNLSITPELNMGETVLSATPLLIANIDTIDKTHIDELKSRIIIDGISYKPLYDKVKATLSLQVAKPLKEKFHIVTFEVWDHIGRIERATRIFYIAE